MSSIFVPLAEYSYEAAYNSCTYKETNIIKRHGRWYEGVSTTYKNRKECMECVPIPPPVKPTTAKPIEPSRVTQLSGSSSNSEVISHVEFCKLETISSILPDNSRQVRKAGQAYTAHMVLDERKILKGWRLELYHEPTVSVSSPIVQNTQPLPAVAPQVQQPRIQVPVASQPVQAVPVSLGFTKPITVEPEPFGTPGGYIPYASDDAYGQKTGDLLSGYYSPYLSSQTFIAQGTPGGFVPNYTIDSAGESNMTSGYFSPYSSGGTYSSYASPGTGQGFDGNDFQSNPSFSNKGNWSNGGVVSAVNSTSTRVDESARGVIATDRISNQGDASFFRRYKTSSYNSGPVYEYQSPNPFAPASEELQAATRASQEYDRWYRSLPPGTSFSAADDAIPGPY